MWCSSRRRCVRFIVMGILLGSAVGSPPWAQEFVLEQKLAPESVNVDDFFGRDVAVDGRTLVVGASADFQSDTEAGHAYVYRYDAPRHMWVEEQVLVASDGIPGDGFGYSVAVSGDTIAVGMPYDDGITIYAGSVYVFRHDPSTSLWVESQKLEAPQAGAGDYFGNSVAIDENTLVAGAYCAGYQGTGAAYVYRFNGTSWYFEQKLTASDPDGDDFFGYDVAVDGDVILAGAPQGNSEVACKAYFFRYTGPTNGWIQEKRVATGRGTGFGTSVDVEGSLAAIGGPARYGSGAVWIYSYDGVTWQGERILPENPIEHEYFGSGVAVVQYDQVIVGAHGYYQVPGAIHLLQQDAEQGWVEIQWLRPPDVCADDEFGDVVASTGEVIVVGAPFKEVERGAAYVYAAPLAVPNVPPKSNERLSSGPRRIWQVGPVGADYPEIQAAIDAANEGDVILVEPAKTYLPFVLWKPLTVMANRDRFEVSGGSAIIQHIPAGKKACLAGIWGYSGPPGGFDRLSITDCQGQVVVDNAWFRIYINPEHAVDIQDCSLVFLSDVTIKTYETMSSDFSSLRIRSSHVVASQIDVEGISNGGTSGSPGGLAAASTDSHVVLARPRLVGGNGGDGGGRGGTGLKLEASDVLVLGCCGDYIKGGDGGPHWGKGGDGGAGISGSRADLSDVILEGGQGGSGSPPGDDGPAYDGDVSFVDPPFPVLDLPGDLHPGSTFVVTVHGEPGSHVFLVISDRQGWEDLPSIDGPPLSALSGGTFFIGLDAGVIGGDRSLSVPITLPDNGALPGVAITAQAMVIRPDRSAVLSNAATRIVGE